MSEKRVQGSVCWKKDARKAKNGWAPGRYLHTCSACRDGFTGAKRAWECADCAYSKADAISAVPNGRGPKIDKATADLAAAVVEILQPMSGPMVTITGFMNAREKILRLCRAALGEPPAGY